MRALFVSKNLIGDAMYISQALNAWYKQETALAGVEPSVYIETLRNHVAPMYKQMGVPVNGLLTDDTLPAFCDFIHTFDVTKAFQLCDQKKIHIAEAYAELLGVELEKKQDNSHLRPIYIPYDEPVEDDLKGCILVSMFSNSCSSQERDETGKLKGKPPNKMLPWPVWTVILRYLRTLGYPLRFIGGMKDRTDTQQISEEEWLLGVPMNKTALIMQHAKLVVTLDNGMSHLAASQNTPTFLFYPACLGPHYILPKGNRNLQWIHMDPTRLHPAVAVLKMKQAMPWLLARKKE